MLAFAMVAALATQWPEKEWAFKPVEGGGTSPIQNREVVILRTEEEFRKYMMRRGGPRRPLPKINWRLNQVVAVHLGDRPTAGYSVDVKHVWKAAHGAEVEVEVTKPAPDMLVAQVITYPFTMVRTERFAGTATLRGDL